MFKKLLLVSLVVCMISFLFGCANEEKSSVVNIGFDTLDISDEENGKVLQKIIVMQAKVNENTIINTSIDRINENTMNNAVKFKNENHDEIREMIKDNPDAEYEYSVELGKSYEDDKYIVLTENTYQFTMGAHGGTLVKSHNIEKETGKELKLLDVIKDKDIFKKELINNIKDLPEDYFIFDDFEDTVDKYLNGEYELEFAITEDSVSVIFQQYDIAPYSSGIIMINMDKELLNI